MKITVKRPVAENLMRAMNDRTAINYEGRGLFRVLSITQKVWNFATGTYEVELIKFEPSYYDWP